MVVDSTLGLAAGQEFHGSNSRIARVNSETFLNFSSVSRAPFAGDASDASDASHADDD
jgi:hypothetical protein